MSTCTFRLVSSSIISGTFSTDPRALGSSSRDAKPHKDVEVTDVGTWLLEKVRKRSSSCHFLSNKSNCTLSVQSNPDAGSRRLAARTVRKTG